MSTRHPATEMPGRRHDDLDRIIGFEAFRLAVMTGLFIPPGAVRACGPLVAGCRGAAGSAVGHGQADPFMPVHFRDPVAMHAPALQMGFHAQRHIVMTYPPIQLQDAFPVEVIEMVVRNQDGIDVSREILRAQRVLQRKRFGHEW